MTEQKPTWPIVRRFDDLSLFVRAKYTNEVVVDFEVFRFTVNAEDETTVEFEKLVETHYEKTANTDKADTLVEGHIKFDGCSNLTFGSGGYIHSCSREQLVSIGLVLDRMFDIAVEMIRAVRPELAPMGKERA